MSSKEDGSDGVGTVMTYGKPDNNKALKRTWNYDLKSSQSYYQGSLSLSLKSFFIFLFFLSFLFSFLFF